MSWVEWEVHTCTNPGTWISSSDPESEESVSGSMPPWDCGRVRRGKWRGLSVGVRRPVAASQAWPQSPIWEALDTNS